ncbi:uncharacterized protein ASCRUDRAFT_76522 [Ascoidea rubescens DSM 1968]|uniref:Uncharacterized protein n=1 Tax=Ascoidea rubescens DSM 1968 TaxID=1344418 RepID=A0A1D2VGF0_9ASCO|nr:hypothetical protein ASCRUDRAFT_76522 [Ascoidea rubescens DSM 1968]ODV60573.1 hypothetical protein ASCRUDRAFT_76522 [Ascoidea rubescens DSM 1968]
MGSSILELWNSGTLSATPVLWGLCSRPAVLEMVLFLHRHCEPAQLIVSNLERQKARKPGFQPAPQHAALG